MRVWLQRSLVLLLVTGPMTAFGSDWGDLMVNGFVRTQTTFVPAADASEPSMEDGFLPVAQRSQRGKASYYGPGFHGRRTASGIRYNQHDLVAAHPSLPFGTVARVTNLRNGRSTNVRIVDRGPARSRQRAGVVIDLSVGAARELDFVRAGKTQVEIVPLGSGGSKRKPVKGAW